jgi:alkaline phosphatase D
MPHVQVNGLAAGRSYFYRFMQGDATSTTGRCCTAPAPGATVQRLRLAFASCQRWEHGHYAAWRSVVQDQPDLVLFLGDYIYEYAQPAKTEGLARPQPLRTARTLQDYRDRYALHKSDPLLQAAHAQCNWSVIWDDHEVENDYAADQGLGEATAFLARRMAAWQAFYENMPLRAGHCSAACRGCSCTAVCTGDRWPGSICWMAASTAARKPAAHRARPSSGSVHADRCPGCSPRPQLSGPGAGSLAGPPVAGRQPPPRGSRAVERGCPDHLVHRPPPAQRRPVHRQLGRLPGSPPAPDPADRRRGPAQQRAAGRRHPPELCLRRPHPGRPAAGQGQPRAGQRVLRHLHQLPQRHHPGQGGRPARPQPQVLLARCEERGYSLVDITPRPCAPNCVPWPTR